MTFLQKYQSPLGELTLACDDFSLVGLWFKDQKHYAKSLIEPSEERNTEIFNQTREWLDIYFSGKQPGFTPALSPQGSKFRQCIFRLMLDIPYGKTVSYGDLAAAAAIEMGLGAMSPQAVGGAVGHNPISIIIPCHRVVGRKGSLTGYAGGLDKKIWLLKNENANMEKLYIPDKKVKAPQ